MDAQASNIASLSSEPSLEAKRKNAIKGAFFSEFIDMFDIYLPVVVLTPVLFFFRPAHLSAATEAILDSLVFITTLLGRPVGALLFGRMADRIGRRKSSICSVFGFGVITLLIALLPGYETLGVFSYCLLILLRFVDGVFLGGGYTSAIPLALEYSRKDRRGLVGGFIISGFPGAYVTITLVAMLMLALFPLDGPHSPYVQWGWRIPFVIGAILAGALGLHYVFNVSESEIWKSETREGREDLPLFHVLRGKNGRSLIQILVLMTGFWLTQNIITIFVPSVLLAHWLQLTGFQVNVTLLISYSLLVFSYIGSGMLSQKIGRRRFFIIIGPLIATVGAALLYVLASVRGLSLPMIILLVSALSVIVASPWGVIMTYLNERFATDIRATGFGVGLGFSIIVPAFYAVYVNWVGLIMPLHFAPAALLCLGGLIGTFGAVMGPETKNVDF